MFKSILKALVPVVKQIAVPAIVAGVGAALSHQNVKKAAVNAAKGEAAAVAANVLAKA